MGEPDKKRVMEECCVIHGVFNVEGKIVEDEDKRKMVKKIYIYKMIQTYVRRQRGVVKEQESKKKEI